MSEIEHWHFDVCPDCGAPPFQHGLDAPWFCTHPRDRYVPIKVVAASHLEGAVEALREIANDTTHDGRWGASRAEAALVAMGVDPRIPGGSRR